MLVEGETDSLGAEIASIRSLLAVTRRVRADQCSTRRDVASHVRQLAVNRKRTTNAVLVGGELGGVGGQVN